jgi:hypothetical protein
MAPEAEPAEDAPGNGALLVGVRVEVRNDFDGSWTTGFEVAEVTPDGLVLRRRSDGEVLPTEFPPDAVRRERRKSMWWV